MQKGKAKGKDVKSVVESAFKEKKGTYISLVVQILARKFVFHLQLLSLRPARDLRGSQKEPQKAPGQKGSKR